MIGTSIAHYLIEEKLGQGGMGVVYRARDTKLDRTVALKFLPLQLSDDDEAKARFVQEARAASALDDDNICTIYEIGSSDDGRMYIAMTYYGGEPLNERLARHAAMSLQEALSIGRQIASGLRTAHEHGIVHRDIKPGNVMLTDRGRVKILDFGLAKLGQAGDLTKSGSTLGTTSYMSPEQVRGEETDTAVDVWALGVLLYELLAGDKPFRGDYEQAVLYAILNEEPEPVETVRPDVPESVAEIIGRCLRKDAADRPSAKEILDVLVAETPGWTPESTIEAAGKTEMASWYHEPWKAAAAFGGFALVVVALVYTAVMQFGLPDWVLLAAIVLIAAGFPIVLYAGQLEKKRAASSAFRREEKGLGRIVTWSNAWYGGLIAFGGLGLVAGGYMIMRVAGIGPAATLMSAGVLDYNERVVLADLENRTDDPTLATSITEALRIDLNQSQVISLLDRSEVAEGLARMNVASDTMISGALARELAQREGLKAVVQGEVGRLGKGFVLIASVTSAADGRTYVSLRETADDEGGIIDAVDRLSAALREEIGESLKTIRSSPPLSRVTTASLAALRKYSEAESSTGDRHARLLREAIALDSTFAMAYRKLAVELSNSAGDYSEHIAAATKAYMLRDRLPESEQLQTEAYYHMSVDYDLDRVASAYRRILELSPDDYIALNNLGTVLQRQGEIAEAARLYRRSVDERPSGWASWTNLVEALCKLDRVDDAWNVVAEFDTRDEPGILKDWLRQIIYSTQREPDSVLASLGPWLDDDELVFRWWATRFYTSALASTGKLGDARRLRDRLDELSAQRGLPEWRLLHRVDEALEQTILLGASSEAAADLEETLREFPLSEIATYSRPYPEVAAALAFAGDAARARQILEEYEREIPEGVRKGQPARHLASGALAIAEDRLPDAVRHLEALNAECENCALYALALAHERSGNSDAALQTLEGITAAGKWDSIEQERWTLAPSFRMLAELHEERGEVDRAIEHYTRFVTLWKNADAVLQPQVEEVRLHIDQLLKHSAREPGV